MGAWGIGVFQDDTGCDVRDDIAESSDIATELRDRLQRVISTELAHPLDYQECFDAIVPATIVDAYVNGTSLVGLDDFRKQHPAVNLEGLASLGAAAVDRVLAPNAELHELWAENKEEYQAWRTSLEGLRDRLAVA
jgi:hypothetical protein